MGENYSENYMKKYEGNGTTLAENASKLQVFTEGKLFDFVKSSMVFINIWPLVLVFIYAILGVIGNSIVIYVYWTKWKRNKTRVFILCLGILDLVNCAFNMPVEVAVLWKPLTFDLHYLCKISRGITFVINNTGSLVFVSIAIERYMLVYHPLKYRQMTPKFAKLMCLLAFIISSSVSWPSFIFYGTRTFQIEVPGGMVQGKTCLISDAHRFNTGQTLIFTTILFALLILTFIVLTTLYIAIGRKIYLATCTDISENESEGATKLFGKSIICALTGGNGKRSASFKRQSYLAASGESPSTHEISELSRSYTSLHESGSEGLRVSWPTQMGKQNSLKTLDKGIVRMSRKFSTVKAKPTRKNTVMMRVVTIAFMISFTPFLCILIIRYTDPMYYQKLNTPGKIAYGVLLRTYFINSMVNPFIYGFMNLRFRQHVKCLLKNVFCCCRNRS